MKAGLLAVAAAMAAGVSAKGHKHPSRHNHEAFHAERGMANETCVTGCTTIYSTIYGEATLYNPPPATTSKPAPAPTYPATVPTPYVTTCPTPGVYTIPETTITVTEEVTVCGASSTKATPGTNTAGGVTTVVEHSTTVVCPYATTVVSGGVTTSTISTTSYVCPSAGTYTIAPVTTVVESETVWVYPTVTSYPPGTYTHSKVIETVTETDYVIFCPYTSSAAAVPAPTYAASKPAPSSSKPGELGNSGTKWAVTYSQFTDSGNCKDAGSVETDIEAIAKAGYTTVRIYASVCTGLVNVGAACEKNGLKMIIGVFIDDTGLGGAAAEDVKEIIAWAKWELVELIVIGNEAIFSGHCSAGQLADFIGTTKAAFAAHGYTGPCTTTEPLNILQENYEILCEVVDITGCNIHPYFNPSVEASAAGPFVANQLSIVEGLCPGKGAINLETGWPSKGERTSPEDQVTALKSIADTVGGKSVVLSFFNDLWKAAGDCGCEDSFGIYDIVTYF